VVVVTDVEVVGVVVRIEDVDRKVVVVVERIVVGGMLVFPGVGGSMGGGNTIPWP